MPMLKPDYSNSIVNLVASITKGLGGEPHGYQPLDGFGSMGWAQHPLVLLIVDGLGDLFLEGYPESFLWGHRQGQLTSVFPPTTATAITSFFTGVAPQQHAITGWHTYFKELGAVATILPFIPRYRGGCFSEAGISPAQLVGHGSLLDRLPVPCETVLPAYLADSDYSRMLSGRAGRHGYESLEEMFATIAALVADGKPGFIMAYWPELDSLAHSHGMASPEVDSLFRDFDAACRHSLDSIAQQGGTVIVTADHGLIDTVESDLISLEDHPRLAAMLTLPLCGEPRCASCYVRSDCRQEFEDYIAEHLSAVCELRTARELIDQGYFGAGPVSPRLRERLGEYVLLMKGNALIKDRLITEKRFAQRGVHGGLSAQELYVPLIVVDPGNR